MKTFSFPILSLGVLLSLAVPHETRGQGMPAEARKNIHLLFDEHARIQRTVELTTAGYIAVTESDDPKIAIALRDHVKQMTDRLDQGLPVRRHDPAFRELLDHHSEIKVTVSPTEKGLKVEVSGTTPEGVQVAQNHARVVSEFAAQGWEAHNRDHPAVLSPNAGPSDPSSKAPEQCGAGGACCKRNAAGKAQAPNSPHH